MRTVPFHKPSIGEDEISAVADVMRSGWLTTGPKTKEFEAGFASAVGAAHAVAVNSCTAALHLALESIGVGEADEVVTTTMTFAATAEVVRYLGARPVLADIDPATMNISTKGIEKALKGLKRPKAIIPVHYAGLPCDMDEILSIAKKHDLRVIEDAAHAFPAHYHGRPIGSIGGITCFSFYATKNITTGEGGMAVTANPEWAERMRIMSLHGISKDAWKRYTSEGSWHYEILAPGFKYNMTDMAAALGIEQLKKAELFRRKRESIALEYTKAFSGIALLRTPAPAQPGSMHGWHLYVLRLNLPALSIDRAGFMEELKKRGIGTSVHFIPLHMHPYYRETYGYAPDDFPEAREAFHGIISLPIYPSMTDDDVSAVIGAVAEVSERFKR